MSEDRKQEGLSALGHKTAYSTDYNPDVLEAFENLNKENDYWVRFNCPEFTALCPITGQPDFAEIRISYIPDVKMVESKSLKLYLHSYDGSQVHRGDRLLCSARRHINLSVRQLRPSRHQVRETGRAAHGYSRVTQNETTPLRHD